MQGGFTYSEPNPTSPGRVPTTLVVSVPLANKAQVVTAVWSGIRGSTAIIDQPATLSTILT